MINENNVMDYITSAGKIPAQNSSIWVICMPSVFDMAVFGHLATIFKMKYSILNVSPNGLMIIAVNNLGKMCPEHIWLNKGDIEGIKITKKLTHYIVEIEISSGTLKYRLNKVMVGSNFHKKNLDNVIMQLQQFNK